MKKNINKKYVFLISLITLSLFIYFFVGKSYAVELEDGSEVAPSSQLTYFLKVTYDGVDKDGIESSDSASSQVKSDYIYVTDKLPDGLEFVSFSTTHDGSIGAVQRGGHVSCDGKVVDDTKESSNTGEWNNSNTEFYYHGLHYNKNTRIISFTVENLKAGCELSVGIETVTPATVDDPNTSQVEVRRDFYNFATVVEKGLTVLSNLTHLYMGRSNVTLYDVVYQYEGTVPSNAPSVPGMNKYVENYIVSLADDAKLEGYSFSGWTTADAMVENRQFTMPNKTVTLKGSFTKTSGYTVKYQIDGTLPKGYIVPQETEYYPGNKVNVDSLKAEDVIGDYRFLGWETEDVTISNNNDFVMPDNNVVLKGKFEKAKYKVTYEFFSGPLPPNADSLLPEEKYYEPGSTVTLESVTEPTGYKFLGWYKESNFVMPREDVVIYGEWQLFSGTFAPTIKKEIIDNKESYQPGDIVNFKITVKNTASFDIREVVVKERNENATFIDGEGYIVMSKHYASIASIPAGGEKELYVKYRVSHDEFGIITNVAEIVGALADNDYELEDKEYIAEASFNVQSKIKVCKTVLGNENDSTLFQFEIKGITNSYETWIKLTKDECKTIYVQSGTYSVREIIPQEYTLKSISGAITTNNGQFIVASDAEYAITFTNEYNKKGYMHSHGRAENKVINGGE